MSFSYEYTVQFRDTDAAGVVYFASILSICHIAYEASLIQSGIDLKLFVSNPEYAVPITQVGADFMKPLYCGDRVLINLTPAQLDEHKFEIKYTIYLTADRQQHPALVSATVQTKHVVIDPCTRQRKELPPQLVNWLSV